MAKVSFRIVASALRRSRVSHNIRTLEHELMRGRDELCWGYQAAGINPIPDTDGLLRLGTGKALFGHKLPVDARQLEGWFRLSTAAASCASTATHS